MNNLQQYLCNLVCSSIFLYPTSEFEICCIINQLNTNKSCGSDGIEAKFIVLASEVLSPVLAILFNACFDFRIFPTCLKTAKVVPAYKAGDKNQVTNYRPILILSIFSKILEKLVHTRTLSFLKCHSVLAHTQYGFRPKYSNLHALLDITNSALDNIEKKLYTGLVFLDLTKAFDTVNYSILLYKLERNGIRGIVNNFFGRRRRRLKRYPLQVRHKQDWGRGFILLLPQTAALPGSDAGSDVIKPASSFVIQNRQTACSMWCPMYRARC